MGLLMVPYHSLFDKLIYVLFLCGSGVGSGLEIIITNTKYFHSMVTVSFMSFYSVLNNVINFSLHIHFALGEPLIMLLFYELFYLGLITFF